MNKITISRAPKMGQFQQFHLNVMGDRVLFETLPHSALELTTAGINRNEFFKIDPQDPEWYDNHPGLSFQFDVLKLRQDGSFEILIQLGEELERQYAFISTDAYKKLVDLGVMVKKNLVPDAAGVLNHSWLYKAK